MSEEYWDGATWHYHCNIANGVGSGGTIQWDVEVPVGDEMELLYGMLTNGDTSTRTGRVYIVEATDNIMVYFQNGSLTAGLTRPFPAIVTDLAVGARYILSGGMKLIAHVVAVASTENATLAVACRIRGGVPTVSESGQDTPTITINTEAVV